MLTVFENPIIPRFAPDPSVVSANRTFFLVHSSFYAFPGVPVYSSKDLKAWKHIGNAINRESQLSLYKSVTFSATLENGSLLVASTGAFAPTIRYHRGVFYIVCTNVYRDKQGMRHQNFYITTTDIWSNSWSDPIAFEFNGIDPSLFFDDDDRAYIQGAWSLTRLQQPASTIKQLQIDIKTGKPLSGTKEIWQGFARHDTEGPHMYKKDGYYYLLVAEGGTFEHHMLSMARSKSIWGPYESYKKNPVLTADGTDEYIQNTGHGQLFEDSSGQWWAAVLGVCKDGGYTTLSRETFLTSVRWPSDGWPQIEHPKMRFEHHHLPTTNTESLRSHTEQQERVDDVFIRNPVLDAYNFSPNGREITLVPSMSTLSAPTGTVTFVGKRQRSLDCSANATVIINAQNAGNQLETGLALYRDDFRYVQIYYDHQTFEICLKLHNKLDGDRIVRRRAPGDLKNVDFKIEFAKNIYGFHYSAGKENSWVRIGSVNTRELFANDFTGPVFGIFAFGLGAAAAVPVTFSSFEITNAPSTRIV